MIRAARSGSDLGFSEREGLLLRYADDITRTPIDVDLQVFRQLRRHFTHEQIVEITATICYENFRTRFRNAMGVEAGVPEEQGSTPANGTPAGSN
jgi:alkylhydroperoxidase family enzyme